VLDGIVIVDTEIARSQGMVMYNCPDGDVTGAELDACTIWQNVIYDLGRDGSVGLMPAEDEPAAARLLLPDFGRALGYSEIYAASGLTDAPWDVFRMSGCQE
jgi:hypothetical protein